MGLDRRRLFITKGRERSKAKVEEDEKKDDQNEGGE